jgi:hypothetical protein
LLSRQTLNLPDNVGGNHFQQCETFPAGGVAQAPEASLAGRL